MSTIHVKDRLGGDIVTREHGRRLYLMVREAADRGDDRVTVDFNGLQVTSVSFFDEAFGQLARELGYERFANLVRLKDIDPFDDALVNDIVISRARQQTKGNRGKRPRRTHRGAA